jgi:hypothetical protein
LQQSFDGFPEIRVQSSSSNKWNRERERERERERDTSKESPMLRMKELVNGLTDNQEPSR